MLTRNFFRLGLELIKKRGNFAAHQNNKEMEEITFLRKRISTEACAENILKIYEGANKQSENWYRDAHQFCREVANQYNIEFIKVAGIVAALSPRKRWTINKEIAVNYIQTGTAGQIKMLVEKCRAIMSLECATIAGVSGILNGPKISSFFKNIVDYRCDTEVTIDRHAICVAVGKVIHSDNLNITDDQYQFFARSYQIAAQRAGTSPLRLQAATWVRWREMKKSKKI